MRAGGGDGEPACGSHAGGEEMTDRQRTTARVRRIAREAFDYDSLRPGQREAILAVLDGHERLTTPGWAPLRARRRRPPSWRMTAK